MKKAAYALTGILCGILLSMSAKADVIWEPEDSFYWKHSKECTYVNRTFTADGPENKVISYKSPQLPQEVETLENGRNIQIYFTYEDGDGILWGLYDDFQGTTGWVPLDYMKLLYDSISFMEEHEEEIVWDTGSLDEKNLGEEIYLWEYPGSEVYMSIKTDSYMPEYSGIYVDGNGNQWGHVGYYFGIKDTWAFIDDPTAGFDQIFPEGVPEADRPSREVSVEETAPGSLEGEESREPDGEGEMSQGLDGEGETSQGLDGAGASQSLRGEGKEGRIRPKLNRGIVAAAVILVLSVAAVTAVLLKRLKGRNEKPAE